MISYIASAFNGEPTPDNPFIMTMEFSASTPANYGLINGGDSGGPALYGNNVLGSADFGNLPRAGD